MSTKHEIKVSITPLCSSCGAELMVGGTESKPVNHPLERDDPWNRVDQRVFIYMCQKCFLHRIDYDNLLAALKDCRSGLIYIRERHGELYGVGFDRAISAADAAIAKTEGKL